MGRNLAIIIFSFPSHLIYNYEKYFRSWFQLQRDREEMEKEYSNFSNIISNKILYPFESLQFMFSNLYFWIKLNAFQWKWKFYFDFEQKKAKSKSINCIWLIHWIRNEQNDKNHLFHFEFDYFEIILFHFSENCVLCVYVCVGYIPTLHISSINYY